MVRRRGLSQTNYWESEFSQDGSRTVEVLLNFLEQLPEGVTELLCHPGTEGWRLEDYQALLDPLVKQRIEELGVQLIDYRALKSL
jgi:hypothetical protein